MLRPVIERVVDELDSPRTSVVVQMNARQAIYEVGVGGSTHPTRGSVVISLSDGPDEDKDKRALTTWLAPTVAHELNHSARIIDGPGYGRSLLATMVANGKKTVTKYMRVCLKHFTNEYYIGRCK